MATYSVTTGPRQETILGKVLVKVNQARALNSQAALTLAQLVQRLFNDSLDGYAKQDDDETAVTIFAAYTAAAPAVQASVKTALGIP